MHKKTPKYLEAVEILPPELVPIFDELLAHYKYVSLKVHGKEFSSPLVIAELVLLGWRDVEAPVEPIKSKD